MLGQHGLGEVGVARLRVRLAHALVGVPGVPLGAALHVNGA